MEQKDRRFLLILGCAIAGFFLVDAAIKQIRNADQAQRLRQVRTGMTEADAVRILSLPVSVSTNGMQTIWVQEHQSFLDRYLLFSTPSHADVVGIQSGKVVSVGSYWF